MKVLLFNCHGKQKIVPTLFSIPIGKNVKFLCKEGKTLSVDQVKEFIDNVLVNPNLDQAIQNSLSIKTDDPLTPKEILAKFSLLTEDKKNIQSETLLKIIQLQIDKIENFITSAFSAHNDVINFVIPNLILTHDDVQNGVVSKVVDHLKQKGFIHIGINIYENQILAQDQLYLMCDFQKLKVNGSVSIVYITPSQHIQPLELSKYLESFENAYLLYNQNSLLEAFLDIDPNQKHLGDVNAYMQLNQGSSLYNFGQDNSDVIIGACREFENFDFGHII